MCVCVTGSLATLEKYIYSTKKEIQKCIMKSMFKSIYFSVPAEPDPVTQVEDHGAPDVGRPPPPGGVAARLASPPHQGGARVHLEPFRFEPVPLLFLEGMNGFQSVKKRKVSWQHMRRYSVVIQYLSPEPICVSRSAGANWRRKTDEDKKTSGGRVLKRHLLFPEGDGRLLAGSAALGISNSTDCFRKKGFFSREGHMRLRANVLNCWRSFAGMQTKAGKADIPHKRALKVGEG